MFRLHLSWKVLPIHTYLNSYSESWITVPTLWVSIVFFSLIKTLYSNLFQNAVLYKYFVFNFQTIIHWTSLMLSILFYFAFILIYNSFCITCFGLQNPFWVIHHTMGTAEFWLLILVSCVLALLPRYDFLICIF